MIKKTQYSLLCLPLLFSSCSSPSESVPSEPPSEIYVQVDIGKEIDSLKVGSITIDIGFTVSNLVYVDKSDTLGLFHTIEQLLYEYKASQTPKRIGILANRLANLNLDVVMIQEAAQMKQNGALIYDAMNGLLDSVNSLTTSKYQLFDSRFNEIHLSVKAKKGDILADSTQLTKDSVLDISFSEGNAILIKSQLNPYEFEELYFNNVLSLPFLDSTFTSMRMVQSVKIKTKNQRIWDLNNTHLEISENALASFTKNQATELLYYLEDHHDTSHVQILGGTINYSPGIGAHKILTQPNGFIDLTEDMSSLDNFNCCLDYLQEFNQHSRQSDYLFSRHHLGSPIALNEMTGPVWQADTTWLWGSSHSIIHSKIYSQ